MAKMRDREWVRFHPNVPTLVASCSQPPVTNMLINPGARGYVTREHGTVFVTMSDNSQTRWTEAAFKQFWEKTQYSWEDKET